MVSGEAGSVKYQYLAAICVNIISIAYGAFCGWPSASFLELASETNPPLETGPLSAEDQGWVASTVCLGGIAGTIFFAWLADRIGRKQCLLWMALPCLVGWIIIPFARNPMHLIAARFIGGTTGGGCFAVIPIYTSELAEDSIRGTIGTILVLTCNMGVLMAFILGYYFNYATVAWIFSIFPFVFVVCFWFMPETPQHLAQNNKVEEAELSLRYYRNIRRRASKDLTENLQLELQKLRAPTEKDTEADELDNAKDSGVTWSDFAEPKARKAFCIGLGLVFFNQMCGCFAMLNYTAVIFQQSGSDLSATICAIAVGAIQLVGTYCSTILVERLGRKILLLISAVGICFGQSSMGAFSYLKLLGYDTSSFNWVPVVGFSFMLFIAAWGMLSLPFLVISEIMPPKIRNMANMICMSVLWIIATGTIKTMPLLTTSFGMHGTVFIFATFSFLGALFVAIFVPETKGKTIETLLANL